jgi:hydroxypyruvate isomerase
MPPGDWAAGERGIGALPGRETEFRDGVEKALVYAKATECRLLHAMAGVLPASHDRGEAERVYIGNLRLAADRLAGEGIAVVIEPINTRDIPGYFLNMTTQAMLIIEQVGRPNLKLQLDLYHVQIMEGDLAHRIRALAGHYPHVQIAGNPGRHEPDVGEINYPCLFDLFDELGYAGWIGCEYRPKGETKAGLGWAKRYGIGG